MSLNNSAFSYFFSFFQLLPVEVATAGQLPPSHPIILASSSGLSSSPACSTWAAAPRHIYTDKSVNSVQFIKLIFNYFLIWVGENLYK